MEINEYTRMYQREKTYWWFVNKRLLLLCLIDGYIGHKCKLLRILDIGCGTGATVEALRNKAEVYGLDSSALALSWCRKREVDDLIQGNSEGIPFKANTFDLVLLSDLLEHVDNDAEVLKECYRVLSAHGRLILTVPAFKRLWSQHDVALGHKRRYTAQDLKMILSTNGFAIEKISYYMFLLFVPVVLFRIFKRLLAKEGRIKQSDFLALPSFINKSLLGLLGLERKLINRINFPLGISLLAIGKKE